jgi:NAD(P)-dependent dehydrogenase (short-subunit alcohol dehydrogenase family)
MKLTGKVAVITGASSGIGEVTALAMAQEGAKLVLVQPTSGPTRGPCRKDKDSWRDAEVFTADLRDA